MCGQRLKSDTKMKYKEENNRVDATDKWQQIGPQGLWMRPVSKADRVTRTRAYLLSHVVLVGALAVAHEGRQQRVHVHGPGATGVKASSIKWQHKTREG